VTAVLDYHQNTKHSFHRFARSLGYLDWAAQPDPFRRYDGAPRLPLPRTALRPDVPYSALFAGGADAAPMDVPAVGELLRCAMGLSAWKQYQASRWALRVNPSSGNLHPTECYVVWDGRVCHYAPRDHALEVRAEIGADSWRSAHLAGRLHAGEGRQIDSDGDRSRDVLLVGLTSILWREAWKYGERAFRYCQHDVGHAIGAVCFSAALLGWQVSLRTASDEEIGVLLGTSRDDDYGEAEREEPECLLLVTRWRDAPSLDVAALAAGARNATWSGQANVLSRSHVAWTAIDDVARATRREASGPQVTSASIARDTDGGAALDDGSGIRARRIILQRRSAVGFDAKSSLPAGRLFEMLRRATPGSRVWDAIDWPPQVHLAVFVHRVDGLLPGLYAWLRDPAALEELRAATRPEFLWERTNAQNVSNVSNELNELNNLFLLVPADVRFAANRLSCDQDIASDGFFSLGMIARLEPALRERGDWFYRRLFWECGLIGQVLYLEAEAAGARATGIGCFYDDPVHEVLGLSGMAWQSLYHFSMGVPVDDGRLTTEPGYGGDW
jgi:SagB-type dehydrogenase family enzyme